LGTFEETQTEFQRSEAYKAWVQSRVETIRSRVSAHDVLRLNGIELKNSVGDKAESILCPFHSDNSPSAKVHPQIGQSPSGLYCFTCQERWDVFALWKKFGREDMRFTEVLFGLERAFGIVTPEMPKDAWSFVKKGPSAEETEARDLLEVCEKRMRSVARESFPSEAFFSLGSILDGLHHAAEMQSIPWVGISARARAVLDKIGSKVRSEEHMYDV
jgi:hypothetical protein